MTLCRVQSSGYDYGYDYNNMSLGLHQDEKGYVFHFTGIDSASYRIFSVEVYDPSLQLMGYASVTRTYSENGRPLIFYPFVAAAARIGSSSCSPRSTSDPGSRTQIEHTRTHMRIDSAVP